MVFFNLNRDPFFIYKIFWRISGMWPLDRSKKGSVITFSLFCMLEVVMVLKRLIDPFGKCPAYSLREGEFFNTFWLVVLIIKRLSLCANGRKMVRLIEATIDDWSSITHPEERKIMIRHDNFCSLVLPLIMSLGLIRVLVFVVLALAIPDKFTYLDRRSMCICNNNRIWAIAIEPFASTLHHFEGLTADMGGLLFWSFAMHLAAQNRILKMRFQKFLLINDKEESRRVFRRLVDRHNQLIDLSDDLEESFNFFGVLRVGMSQLSIFMLAFQLGRAIKVMDYEKIMFILINAVYGFATLILYYYAGEDLTTSSEEVGEVFTQCNWYDLSKNSITNFSIIIARCQMSKVLTLWKFHQLNLLNLKHTLQAIYSCVSVIVGIPDGTEIVT